MAFIKRYNRHKQKNFHLQKVEIEFIKVWKLPHFIISNDSERILGTIFRMLEEFYWILE